jgi:aryl-alcohol dehydrogenase-like predicted oxidoreductase
MEQRILGRTGRPVSIIGLGTWQLGADWGSVTEADALAVLHAAADSGVTFFDTADVYGDGRSEKIIGRFLAEAGPAAGDVLVATKMGRRMAQDPENYTLANFRAWTDRSRAGLGVDRLDLVQLHCPPTPVFHEDAVYDALDTLVAEERIAAYGVSVETCAQALAAIARPGLATVQIIFNAFRRKPLDQVLPAAAAAGVGIIVRVPLASGLLSGRYTLDTEFSADDHRSYNRHGEAFDVGETFSGVDYAAGVQAAAEFAAIVAAPGAFAPEPITPAESAAPGPSAPAEPDATGSSAPAEPGATEPAAVATTTAQTTTAEATAAQATTAPATTAQAALRWVTQQPGVTTVIPGARNPGQARQNAAAAALPPLSDAALGQIENLYDKYFRAEIHSRW